MNNNTDLDSVNGTTMRALMDAGYITRSSRAGETYAYAREDASAGMRKAGALTHRAFKATRAGYPFFTVISDTEMIDVMRKDAKAYNAADRQGRGIRSL